MKILVNKENGKVARFNKIEAQDLASVKIFDVSNPIVQETKIKQYK